MRFAFRWGIYGAWPALSKAAPSVFLQTVYLVPRMKMRQHRAIMAYCMRCKFLLCAFYLSWAKGEAARRLAVPPWLSASGRRRGRTVSPVWESENPRLSSAQDGGYLRNELKSSAPATARMTKIMHAVQNLSICPDNLPADFPIFQDA